eukprot:Clim_evm129s149 gene=Clim_evmTU129s149
MSSQAEDSPQKVRDDSPHNAAPGSESPRGLKSYSTESLKKVRSVGKKFTSVIGRNRSKKMRKDLDAYTREQEQAEKEEQDAMAALNSLENMIEGEASGSSPGKAMADDEQKPLESGDQVIAEEKQGDGGQGKSASRANSGEPARAGAVQKARLSGEAVLSKEMKKVLAGDAHATEGTPLLQDDQVVPVPSYYDCCRNCTIL